MRARRPTATARQLFFPAVPLERAVQEKLERSFFKAVRQHNGTYKYTYGNRLDELNEFVADLLPPARPLRLLDVAISSGITTLDWLSSLDRLGIEYTMTAGDVNLWAYLFSLGRHLHVLVDRTGYPLQYDLFGRAVPNPPARRTLPVFLPFIVLLRLLLKARFEHCSRTASAGGEYNSARSWIRCRPLTLVTPRLLENKHIELIEDDILHDHAIRDRFHVIRAANILNRSYFDEAELVAILANLRQRLVEGGLLVICGTIGDECKGRPARISNHASVFALREDSRFELTGRLGTGSVVEDLVLELQPAEVPYSLPARFEIDR